MRYLMILIAVACIGLGGVGVFHDGDWSGIPFLLAGILLFAYALVAKKST